MRVIGTAEITKGAWRFASDDGERTLELRRGDIYSPGNSIGGWYVTGIGRDRAHVARISGAQKRAIAEGSEPPPRRGGDVMLTGRIRLALSSGSARRGLTHRHRQPASPLDAWRLSHGISREVITSMEQDAPLEVWDGGANLRTAATGHASWPLFLVTDGKKEEVRENLGTMIPTGGGMEPKFHYTQWRITGATWAYLREARWNSYGDVRNIWIWPGCDESALVKRLG